MKNTFKILKIIAGDAYHELREFITPFIWGALNEPLIMIIFDLVLTIATVAAYILLDHFNLGIPLAIINWVICPIIFIFFVIPLISLAVKFALKMWKGLIVLKNHIAEYFKNVCERANKI